jgi:16S rRNA (cytidine1402-2'-O)-methyltransferase
MIRFKRRVGLCYNSAVGTLYLVATPIGNLEDITLRALRVLTEVDLIACEDTRRTRKLLTHYDVRTPILSYHSGNELKRIPKIIDALSQGSVALVSDAGTPALSDPGYALVKTVLDEGHNVSPIPGPSSPIAALSISGLPEVPFLFLGYLPRRSTERLEFLQQYKQEKATLVFFETPHRLVKTLEDLCTVFGPDRPAVICREMTKLHEQVHRGDLLSLSESFRQREPRGEFTLVLAGASEPDRWSRKQVKAAIRKTIEEGIPPSKVAQQIAAVSGWTRGDVYKVSLEEE